MNAATMVDLRAAEQDWTCSLLYCLCVCVVCVRLGVHVWPCRLLQSAAKSFSGRS